MSQQLTDRGALHDLTRRMVPWGFPLVYLGWAYLFWTPVVLSDESVWSFPNVIFLGVGGLSPLLAGLVLLWLTRGRDGSRDLRRRLTEVGRISPRWWLLILLYWPAFNGIMAVAALALGVTSTPLEVISLDRLIDPGSVIALVGFAFLVPVVEEVGLRGYWFDQLQARWSALVASLILGLTWATWHIPLTLMTGYFGETTFQPELWWWLPDIVFTAVITTWVYNNTRRSVLAAICFHGFGNLRGEIVGFSPGMYPFVVAGTILVSILLVMGWSPNSLKGWGIPRPKTPTDRSSG